MGRLAPRALRGDDAIGIATLMHAPWAPIFGIVVCGIGAFTDLWLMGRGIAAAEMPRTGLLLRPLPVYLLVFVASIVVYLRNADLEKPPA